MNLIHVLYSHLTGRYIPGEDPAEYLFSQGLNFSVEKTVGFSPIITVSDAKAGEVIDLQSMITAVQEGSGDPSPQNIRPITGFTGLTLHVNSSEIPVTWQTEAGTVYGGVVDLTTGTLTVTHAIVDLGLLDYQYTSTIFMSRTEPYFNNGGIVKFGGVGNKCDIYDYDTVSLTNPINNRIFVSNSLSLPILRISDSRFTDAHDFKTAMSGHYLVYELIDSEKTTYTLTPQTVQLLAGNNTLWNTAGDTKLTYLAKKG